MKAKAPFSHFANRIFFRDILKYNAVERTNGSCAVGTMMTMDYNRSFAILYDT